MENIVVYHLFVHNISLLFVAKLLSCTFIKQKEELHSKIEKLY